MDRRSVNIIALLFAGLICQEIWHFWDHSAVNLVDWFIDPPKYLPDISWYVHDVGQSVALFLWFSAFYLAAYKNRRLQHVLTTFIVYSILDLILFFVCYKVYGYQFVYIGTGVFSYIVIKTKTP